MINKIPRIWKILVSVSAIVGVIAAASFALKDWVELPEAQAEYNDRNDSKWDRLVESQTNFFTNQASYQSRQEAYWENQHNSNDRYDRHMERTHQ